MALQVIGTGFGRTGTDSMREALGLLGYGPCHHMFEIFASDRQRELWRAVAAGNTPDWDALFDGFNSCVDWPSAAYWPQLIDVYPDAKVILTWRDGESWWNSFSKTILPSIEEAADKASLGWALIHQQVFSGRPGVREHAISVYEENVARVKRTVPPERLLVYEIGSGWEPLCRHLGVDIPDTPFPSRNSTKAFQELDQSEFRS